MKIDIASELQKVLDSSFTTYAIHKATGVSVSRISDLRNRKRSIDKISVKTAQSLLDFWNDYKS